MLMIGLCGRYIGIHYKIILILCSMFENFHNKMLEQN